MAERFDELRFSSPVLSSVFPLDYADETQGRHRTLLMLRCRILILVLLILALPLQSFAGGSCCQSGGESCCSRSNAESPTKAESCCSSKKAPAETSRCQHCVAAGKKAEPTASVERCRCQCKKTPSERPATQHRRQLHVASLLPLHDSLFVSSLSPVRTRLQIEVTDRSPGLRLHAVHSVWLN